MVTVSDKEDQNEDNDVNKGIENRKKPTISNITIPKIGITQMYKPYNVFVWRMEYGRSATSQN